MYDTKDWLEIANHAAVIGGVFWAVIQWPKARRERAAAERERSYIALNDHFLKFLELQLASPGLGTNASDRQRLWTGLTPEQQTQQLIQFDYLASILERAYYFLLKSPAAQSDWHREQWKTWDHWVERYALNPNFAAFWLRLEKTEESGSYGVDFGAYVSDKLQRAASSDSRR